MNAFEYDFIRLVKDYLNDTMQDISVYVIDPAKYNSQNYRYGKFYITKKGKVMPDFRSIVSHVEHCEMCNHDNSVNELFVKLDSEESMLRYASLRDMISQRVGAVHSI